MIDLLEIDRKTHPQAAQAVSMLCDYVGGHGRMLEGLASILTEERKMVEYHNLRYMNIIAIRLSSNILLQNYLLPGGMRSFGIVAAALEGLPVDLLDKPFNCEKSYDELLLTGVYPFRDSKSNESFVPRLSLFQIVEWCTRTLKNPPANSRDLQCFFIILHDMLRLRELYVWYHFEAFHFGFEFVRRYARYVTNPGSCSLAFFYGWKDDASPVKSEIVSGRPRTLSLSAVVPLAHLSLAAPATIEGMQDLAKDPRASHAYRPTSGFFSSSSATLCMSPSETFKPEGDLSACLFFSASRQPLFDMVVDQRLLLDGTEFLRIYVQCKWSESADTNDKDLSQWLTTVSSFVASRGSHDSSSTSLFVYVAARHISQNRVDEVMKKHSNVVVLNREALMKMYGPTLSMAHAFQLQVK